MINDLYTILAKDWIRYNSLTKSAKKKSLIFSLFSIRFIPVLLIRVAEYLYKYNFKTLAKIPSLLNVILFGLEVSPRVTIGGGLVITHPQGIVIGARSIGLNVTIFQQVTLGAANIDFEFTPSCRPNIENNVILGAGAKIIGGVTVGSDSIIGANAVIIRNVPSGCVAVGVPGRNLKRKKLHANK